MIKNILILSIFFSMLSAEPLVERTQVHMATFVKISLPLSQHIFFKDAFSIVKKMDDIFSSYNPQAFVYKLNKTKLLIHAPKDLRDLLAICKHVYKVTEGYFSIAIGSLTKELYHFGEADARIPGNNERDNAQSDLLGFFVSNKNVTIKPDVTLDFGGIAKGFTVDKVKKYLLMKKVEKFRIGLSGDIYCQGRCDIALQSPFSRDAIVTVLRLENSAISTSGNYERYIKSKNNNHLLNPKTKRSEQNIASMTLYSSEYNNTLLDALATSLSVMPTKLRMRVLSKYSKLKYLFIENNGQVFHNIPELQLSKNLLDKQ